MKGAKSVIRDLSAESSYWIHRCDEQVANDAAELIYRIMERPLEEVVEELRRITLGKITRLTRTNGGAD